MGSKGVLLTEPSPPANRPDRRRWGLPDWDRGGRAQGPPGGLDRVLGLPASRHDRPQCAPPLAGPPIGAHGQCGSESGVGRRIFF